MCDIPAAHEAEHLVTLGTDMHESARFVEHIFVANVKSVSSPYCGCTPCLHFGKNNLKI